MKYDETNKKWVKAGLYIPEATPVAATSESASAKGKKGAPVKKPRNHSATTPNFQEANHLRCRAS